MTLMNCNIRSFEAGCKEIGISDSNAINLYSFERSNVGIELIDNILGRDFGLCDVIFENSAKPKCRK